METQTFNLKDKNCKIAVIGLGCTYPGAKSPLQLWENILARRQQFREMPDIRLPIIDYYDPDPTVLDKTYQNKAAVLDGYQFNWLDRKIPKSTYESTDIVHWLALDTALQAFADARIQSDQFPRDTTGVILGNTLTGEFTRSNQMMLRWPYVKKVLRSSLKNKGLSHLQDGLETTMEKYYKSVFAPVTEDTLAGGLANTIAGRICNYLDIHGGGYIVDGACASSLLAIYTAANYLEMHQMDLVIAGGVDISLDSFELIGFAKTGALTKDEMLVYDKEGKGFIPGEGCGIVILKRLEDAIRDRNQVYAIIEGWGISSDGKGGITAPSARGQSLALLRAYEKANFDSKNLSFIEGHGTGTAVGDKTELEGITLALSKDSPLIQRYCGVTSFKSIVGHTKAAAGVGAFIKTVMALNRRVIPPTAGLKEFNPIFEEKAMNIYPALLGQVLNPDKIMYAGVSAMGFGGINSHLLLKSGDRPFKKLQPIIDEKILMVSNQSHELFLYTSDDKNGIIKMIYESLQEIKGISYAELADYAYLNNSKINYNNTLRASVVAGKPFELERKLNELLKILNNKDDKNIISFENNTIVCGKKNEHLKVGALYPGQGAQRLNMGYKLIERYDWAKETIIKAEHIFNSVGTENVAESIFRPTDRVTDKLEDTKWKDILKQTCIAQPAITLTSLLWYKYLEKLGIKISVTTGHSLGELMAFYSSGFIDEETLLMFSSYRGIIMSGCGKGAMASLVCSKEKAESYITKAPGYVTLANLNSPEQTVLSGDDESIDYIVKLAETEHIAAVKLPVSAAFHSKLISSAAEAIKNYSPLNNPTRSNTNITLISSVSGNIIDKDTDLNAYFSEQCIKRVNFISAIQSIKEQCDVLVEIGPGKVLSGLSENIQKEVRAFSVEARSNDDLSFNTMLANLFVMGSDIKIEELYKNRLIRDFIPASQKNFIVNPCERPFPEIEETPSPNIGFSQDSLFGQPEMSAEEFNHYIITRGSFIKEVILSDMKYLQLTGKKLSDFGIKPNVKDPSLSNDINNENETGEDVKSLLNKKIEFLTGFPSENFKDNMKLLDDFNLDSIKSGALLAQVIKQYNIQGKMEAAAYLNASIGEITTKIIELTQSINTALKPKSTKNEIQSFVFKLIEEKTGFPQLNLKPEFKLLDDLNLDSIKAGSLMAELTKHFGLLGKMEPARFSNSSLSEIIVEVDSLLGTGENQKENLNNSFPDKKVHSYSVNLVNEDFIQDQVTKNSYWDHKNIALVFATIDRDLAISIQESTKQNIPIFLIEYKELLKTETNFNGLFVLIPYDDKSSRLVEIVDLLSTVSQYQNDTLTDIGFIQFGDGYFARSGTKVYNTNSLFSTSAFAGSLHLERPTIKFRVIEFDPDLHVDNIITTVFKEFTTKDQFQSVGFNRSMQRKRMQYDVTDRKREKRHIELNENDVVLVTGGAKGITSECAFQFAKKYKCKMALVGSSGFHGENGEIKNTLDKYIKEGLIAKYFSCDITDDLSTQTLVSEVATELGMVTAIIHGAGKNIPRRAENVNYKQALDEISPKVMGAINLFNSVNADQIKLYVAFTSIIGVTGMTGNGWYAFSNETLDLFLRNIRKNHKIETITLAYSIWGEIGMGERMGSTQSLAKMGIGAISTSEGVKEFMKWIDQKTEDQQIVIAAALGGLDTWNRKQYAKTEANRYIDNIITYDPGTELKVRSVLSHSTDTYLDDHNYKGSLLFPTVFGIEAMAQVVSMVTGITGFKSIKLENISLTKPIVVPQKGETEIEIHATVLESELNFSDEIKVQVGISTEQSNYTDDHFSALFVIGLKPYKKTKMVDIKVNSPLSLNPISDLYTWLLFQGPRFQLIDKVYEISETKTLFLTKKLSNDSSDVCFSSNIKRPFLLGSPLLRDTLLQSAQIILTKNKSLPIGIKSWEIFNSEEQPNGGMVECTITNWDGKTGIFDVCLVNENKEIIEQINGYSIKSMEFKDNYPDVHDLSDISSYINKNINAEISKFYDILEEPIALIAHKHPTEFTLLSLDDRHYIEQQVYKNYTNGNKEIIEFIGDSCIAWDEKGKPEMIPNKLGISISHCNSLLIMTIGKSCQGCDIEALKMRETEEWKSLLDNRIIGIADQLFDDDHIHDLAYTRIWGVQESCYKAFGKLPYSISINRMNGNSVVFEVLIDSNSFHVLSFPIDLLPNSVYIVSLVIQLKENIKNKVEQSNMIPSKNDSNPETIFDPEQRKFITQFYTAFKDCRGFHGKSYFADFPLWMGTLREYSLSPIKKKLMKDLVSGEFGMVTNRSTVRIYNEAEALDKILGKLWMSEKSDLRNSLIHLGYEWFKYSDDGKTIRLAVCELSTTWVKIEKRGIVKISPIPDYFYTFLDQHMMKGKNIEIDYDLNNYPTLKDLGNLSYKSGSISRPEVWLNKKVYQTGIFNSNSVGNLYYSNYYDWQAKNIESYLFKILPEIYLQNGKAGEYICLETNVKHLQEAMPFEEIEVNMYLEELYVSGCKLYFEYYSLENFTKRKLAYGYNILLWCKRENGDVNPVAIPVPGKLHQILSQQMEISNKNLN